MKTLLATMAAIAACGLAAAQTQPLTVRDLAEKNPKTLSNDEATEWLPAAPR